MWTGAAALGRRLVCKVFGMASPARSSTRYDAGIQGLTVKGLKAECKQRGLVKYSILKKAGLTSLLEEKIVSSAKGSTSVNVGSYGLTVKELIAECKQRALRIHSKLHEVEQVSCLLEALCRPPRGEDSKSTGIGIDELAVTDLKADCKPREQRKLAKPKKAEDKPRGGNDAPPWVDGEDRGKGKRGRETKRPSSRKPEPLQPIAQKKFDDGPTEKDEPGFIYIYFEPGGAENEWKVGRTARDSPEKRMNATAKKNGTAYTLKRSWRVCSNGYAERVVHAEFHWCSVRRKLKEGGSDWAEGGSEWFKTDYAVLEARILLVLEMIEARCQKKTDGEPNVP